ncbi:MAG: guanylate kinase [Pseudomonadota bacterium]
MSAGCLFLVSAPSGAGKTSLVKAALAERPTLEVCVSHTTRKERPGEVDGVNYHFVSEPRFHEMIDAGEFLEHACVFGNYYGTASAQVAKITDQGRDVILEIDWQGAELVRQQVPHAISVFILPPTEATLAQRLRDRGQDSEQVIQQRLSEARLDMSKAKDFDYIIVNDDFEKAKSELLAVFAGAKLSRSVQLIDPAVQALIQATPDPA